MWLLGSLVLISLFVCSATVTPPQSPRANSSNIKQDPAAAFEEGQNAHQRGDLNAAVRLYTTAVTADPTLVLGYYQRAVAFIDLHRGSEAEADLKRVIELQPGFARAHRGLGRLLLDQGRTDESKRAFARALELDPKLAGVRIDYASAMIKSGDAAGALSQLDAAIANGEATALAHALLGVAHERLGKIDEAFAAYGRALEMDPNSAAAREGRARLYETQGDVAKAIADYTVAYRAVLSPEVALKLARLHARAGQAQAAIQVYRRLLLERDDFAVRIEMAKVMLENGQGEEAAKEIAAVAAIRPKDAGLLTMAGDVYSKDKPELAVDYYRRAVDSEPANNRARVQLGAALVRSQQFEAALPVLADAVSREPDNYQAHANLGTACFKLKQYVQAANEFIWIVRTRPEIAVSYYFLAISLDRLGDCNQAVRAYREFVRRADRVSQKNEVDEASIRLGMLQKLVKDGKCKAADKGTGR
jgi:superkiller protein 3